MTSSSRRDTISSWTSSSLLSQNREKKQIARQEVHSPNKNHLIMLGLFAKHTQKFYCQFQRHRWRPRVSCLWGDRHDPISWETTNRPSRPDRLKVLKRLGWSGRSYGNRNYKKEFSIAFYWFTCFHVFFEIAQVYLRSARCRVYRCLLQNEWLIKTFRKHPKCIKFVCIKSLRVDIVTSLSGDINSDRPKNNIKMNFSLCVIHVL